MKSTLIYERRRDAGGVAVLIAGVVPVAIDEAVVQAGFGPVPCGQVWLPKVGTVPLNSLVVNGSNTAFLSTKIMGSQNMQRRGHKLHHGRIK